MKKESNKMRTKVLLFLMLVQTTLGRKDTTNKQAVDYPKFYGIQTRTFHPEDTEKVEVFGQVQNCPIWKSTLSDHHSTPSETTYYLFQNITTGHWHVSYSSNVNEEKCEVTDRKDLPNTHEYGGGSWGYGDIQLEGEHVYQTGLHHPENSTLPKEDSWIDNGDTSRNVDIFAININKTSGFSQSISGYEVYHHGNARGEKKYRTSTIDECVEVGKEDTKKWDYIFFSVKNLYTILDGKIVVDGMLCTVVPFSFSSFDEVSLREDYNSVTFLFDVAFVKTFEEHETAEKSVEKISSLLTLSLIFTLVVIGLLLVIGFLIYRMYQGKRLSVENLRMNQKSAPTIRVLHNNEEDIFVEYKA